MKSNTLKSSSPSVKMSALLSQMTLEEKIGQLQQSAYFSTVVTGHVVDHSGTIEAIKAGRVGSVLSVHDERDLKMLQKTAVEESRLGIPLLFMFDVIHGYKTAFPINLALSNSWDPDLVERVSRGVAYETSHAGLHVTFSPMVDLVRDPRWGRVMESNGEDPYLSSLLAQAYVKGYQQDDLAQPHAIAACVKHFAGYGFAEAGREYNTVDVSERTLRSVVFPPFQAGIDAGVRMVMTAFNVINDRPATANRWLLNDVLRDEMGFQGVIISDYTSTEEIIQHKVATDTKDVAYQCFEAGLDHEMVSQTFQHHLKELIAEGKISEETLNERVLRILTLKEQLGLFDNPYRNFYEDSAQYMLLETTKALAQEAVEKTVVMLKNDDALPLKPKQTVGLFGPFIESQDVIGEWAALCEKSDVITLKQAFDQAKHPYVLLDETTLDTRSRELDTIIVALGEAGSEAGEGNSKAKLRLSASQEALVKKAHQTGKNIVLVVFAGRPLILTELEPFADAILYAYQPGTMSGAGLYRLLSGQVSPSGRLTLTFPYHEGQIPVYYNHLNTGRPFDHARPEYRYNSRFIDIPNEPLYPFGFGLTYGQFEYSDVFLSKDHLREDDTVKVYVTLKNHGSHGALETVQLYIEAQSFSVSRPVNELKAFKQVYLDAGEEKTTVFTLTNAMFKAFNIDMAWTTEQRSYLVKVGPHSGALIARTVQLT